MSVQNKDFKVKNGLSVAGDATVGSQLILGNTPIAFNSEKNRLQILINNSWQDLATMEDIASSVLMSYIDGGTPSTNYADLVFDGGTI